MLVFQNPKTFQNAKTSKLDARKYDSESQFLPCDLEAIRSKLKFVIKLRTPNYGNLLTLMKFIGNPAFPLNSSAYKFVVTIKRPRWETFFVDIFAV